jgi:hypothetical protein
MLSGLARAMSVDVKVTPSHSTVSLATLSASHFTP